MITVNKVKKTFGKQTILRGIDVTIPEGKVVGLLGPNGSGKTTLMKSIVGLVIPDSGEIVVDGQSVKQHWDYREKIGYMPQIARFPENLTVKEVIELIKTLRREKGNEEPLIKLFGLQDFLLKKLRNLSGGTRQKVNATLALMFDVPVYIFDEPTVGLDPYSRLQFKQYVKKQREKGKTIVLTTHILNEIEELADEIILIMEGMVYFQGSLVELKIMHDSHHLEEALAKITKKQVYEVKA